MSVTPERHFIYARRRKQFRNEFTSRRSRLHERVSAAEANRKCVILPLEYYGLRTGRILESVRWTILER